MRSIVRSVLPLALFAAAFAACGKSEPRLSLQMVMYQIDFEEKAMREAAFGGDLAGVVRSGGEIQRWMGDPAFERYLARPNLPGEPAAFAELKAYFAGTLDEVLGMARSGDRDGVRGAYGRMRMACDVCHRDFRPGL